MTRKFTVTFSPRADLAAQVAADVSVEAEYGAVVVEGQILTLAHHQREGKYSSGVSPAPCNAVIDSAISARLRALPAGISFLVSHLDLDTVGGVLRVIGDDDDMFSRKSFWSLAEFVDLNGPHKLAQAGASAEDVRALRAWWAWFRGQRRMPQDKNLDVTDVIGECRTALRQIVVEVDQLLLDGGDEMTRKEDALNAASFVELFDSVAVRVGDAFVNHLYLPPGATTPARGVVGYSTATGSVTVSLADPVDGVSCRDIVQTLWGPEAGGHAGIAGSPRGKRCTLDDLVAARNALAAAVAVARGGAV